jgi:hypothetical protein
MRKQRTCRACGWSWVSPAFDGTIRRHVCGGVHAHLATPASEPTLAALGPAFVGLGARDENLADEPLFDSEGRPRPHSGRIVSEGLGVVEKVLD